MTDNGNGPNLETTEGYRIECDPTKRHDFLYLFDCEMGNPNGDPDADGAPRIDLETGNGIVTGVALKRRLRNFVTVASEYEKDEKRLGIFIAHRGVLNEKIREARESAGMSIGKTIERPVRDAAIGAELSTLFGESLLPNGFSMPDEKTLVCTGELAPNELKEALAEIAAEHGLSKKARQALDGAAREAGKPDKSREDADATGRIMRDKYFDVRMFGAVMQTGLNAGQAHGPLQVVDARSVHPVVPMDMTITRAAVTREEEREEKQNTMGRRHIIPYGLFLTRGFFTPHYARDTGADADDLALFWRSLRMMWDLDRSAARGIMSSQYPLVVFTHENPLGDAPAHKLFSLLKIEQNEAVDVPRSFGDFTVTLDDSALPPGVTVTLL